MRLDPDSRELFEGPNFAHVATIMKDGSPHTVPVWIGVEDDDRLTFYKEESAVAFRNLRRDPRVAISIVDVRNPYAFSAVRGTVVETRGEPDAKEWLRQRAVPYTGKVYPDPMPGPGAVFVVQPERVHFHSVRTMVHTPPTGEQTPGGSADASHAIVERLMAAFDSGDYAKLERAYAEGYVNHNPPPWPGASGDRAGQMEIIRRFREAFPDARAEAQHIVAEGDLVVAHDRVTGTHTGPFGDIAPTGRTVAVEFVHIFRIADGEIAERWGLVDADTLRAQLADA